MFLTMYSCINELKWAGLPTLTQAQLKKLLLEADPDWQHVLAYLSEVKIFVISNDRRDVIAELCLLQRGDEAEIINLAVTKEHRGFGLAKSLIKHAIENAWQSSVSTVLIKTGNSSFDQLVLYQKCGFRMSYIERDVFKHYPEPIYENGIRCIDQVVLSIELTV